MVRAAVACAAILAQACQQATRAPTAAAPAGGTTRAPASQASSPQASASQASSAGQGRPGPLVASSLQVDLRPLGLVPTDRYTLPILSPDGRFLAVQTGSVPDLAALLARSGQQPPLASRIAIYKADPRGILRIGETEAGLVLGRAADARGFLVESPRPDGSRWIGRIAWSGGDVEWLVQDGRINAFATLGPGGELAYATRAIHSRVFDLAVRRDGRTEVLAGEEVRSHVLPVFSADGSRLFSIVLRDGVLELASVDPSDAASMRQSLVRAFISDRASDLVAWQMLAPQGARDGVDGRDWVLFHPGLGTLVRWNEVDGIRAFQGAVLSAGSIDESRTALLVDGAVRIRSRNEGPGEQVQGDRGTVLFEGAAVPRRCAAIDGAPAVMLVVPSENGVRLLLARLPTPQP